MRLFYLLLIMLVSNIYLNAQNYYVAVVKGKVFYEDKILKKRDKIKMKGVMRFTSNEDYVKVSGPGGLYTISPGIDAESSNEFLVAVREEFFPRVRTLSTSENDIVVDPNYYFNQRGFSATFLDKTHFYATVPDLNTGEELGYLHETDQGLFYKTALIEDGLLTIRKSDFSLSAELIRTAIVLVRDKSKWIQLIQNKQSIAQLHNQVSHYNMESAPPELSGVPDAETGEIVPTEATSPAEILDYMDPPQFVNRKAMAEDLRFHIKACKARDIVTFLEEFGYQQYIMETFGDLRDSDIVDVLRNDLKLKN